LKTPLRLPLRVADRLSADAWASTGTVLAILLALGVRCWGPASGTSP
jgi:hypothetical protein